ncbi:MAG: cytochrome c [Burkholderiales bacterium]|nr:cytochrome c [Burkholderiales bacterium]
MNDVAAPPWLEWLIAAAFATEDGLRRLLHAVGLTGQFDGQPAWPFAVRFTDYTLRLDLGFARNVGWTVLMVGAAFLLLSVAIGVRRLRIAGFVVAALLLAFAPWPRAALLFDTAYPTSFHRTPTRFDAATAAWGRPLYERHCAGCHGVDGGGDGPLAPLLTKWPPTLNGALLWQRSEGDLFWRIRHGVRAPAGLDGAMQDTMPGFAAALSEDDTWAILDYLQANAAGASIAREGLWRYPVQGPDFEFRCDGEAPRRLRDLSGQRIRLIFGGVGLPSADEDPRVTTITVLNEPHAAATGCRVVSPQAWATYARIAGVAPTSLAGTQLLIDRGGWLRARARPGAGGWSVSDLLCRTERSGPGPASPAADLLGALIATMDADPVVLLRGRKPH